MALLSEVAIRKRLTAGDLVIDPLQSPEQFDSDSVEVHLGNKVYVWDDVSGGAGVVQRLWDRANFNYKKFADRWLKTVTPDEDGIITMRPGRFYLADLKQYTKLPRDVAMHIEGKSTLARLGLTVHLTAPHAHAGWHGRITLEMYNFGPFNLEMKPGIPIGQLTFWRVEDPPDVVASKTFTGQEKASGAKE
jgi:dCTP deaminase